MSALVSVVTPVHNGAKYLRECIESVSAQTYDNWDYTIVDNCSTDDTVAIAREYAAADPRITVQQHDRFVGVVESHNRAWRAVSPDAVYAKLVSADDWLFADCLERLVEFAERHPSAGVISSYSANRQTVRFEGPPLREQLLDGRDAGRRFLLGEIDSFFVPSVVLYRAPLVRDRDPFWPGSEPSADISGCLDCLLRSDLGFVHQILSFERLHDEMITARLHELNLVRLDRMRILTEYGPRLLTAEEQAQRMEALLSEYFEALAVDCLRFRGRDFWRLHRRRLHELGQSLHDPRFARALSGKLLDLALNPKATSEKAIVRVRARSAAGARSG